MIEKTFVVDKLKSKIVKDEIVLEEWTDKNKARNTISIEVDKFVALFKNGIADEDNKLGFKKYIENWKKEGLI
jgi:hypothetical protein